MLLYTEQVLRMGLGFMRVKYDRIPKRTQIKVFRMHFGSAPLDLSEMWFDLMHTDIINAQVPANSKKI